MKTITKMKDMDTTLLVLDLMNSVNQIATDEEHDKVVQALVIASTLHINDFRHSPRSNLVKPPYMEHVLRVAIRPIKYFNITDINVVITALLHDTVEDHAKDFFSDPELDETLARDMMIEHFSYQFSTEIADSISRLTNPVIDPNTPKTVKQEMYREHVQQSTKNNSMALIVKVSDFIDNAGSLHVTHATKKNSPATKHLVDKYTPLTEYFVNAVNDTLPSHQSEPILNRLEAVRNGLDSLR